MKETKTRIEGTLYPFKTLLVGTPAIHSAMRESREFCEFILNSIQAYASHDWGEISSKDKEMNEKAVPRKEFIIGKYVYQDQSVFIITEWGHKTTTVCFCNER